MVPGQGTRRRDGVATQESREQLDPNRSHTPPGSLFAFGSEVGPFDPGLLRTAPATMRNPCSFPTSHKSRCHLRQPSSDSNRSSESSVDGPMRRTATVKSCSYTVPLGSIGQIFDDALLHRVAEATIENFVNRIAEALVAG